MKRDTLATVTVLWFSLCWCQCLGVLGGEGKTRSLFMPRALRERVWANIRQDETLTRLRDQLIQRACPWMELSDDRIWGLMFGPGITRSWMVWSDGHCPACGKSVPLYNWQMDALSRPWKTWCPHCAAVFPSNDFEAFYKSGLDKHGIFDPARADHSLLFNAAHPDPNDPLHRFGVDDGEGFVQDDKRWRFIGAYLIYGQWKQAVLGGINALSEAYVLTGDKAYARKAGILLDRVADVYPSFDFAQQAVIYLANDAAVAGLPHDMFDADPAAFRARVARVIAEHGAKPKHESVNKQQWRIALLKSGAGSSSRVAWLNYEAGGGHGHLDGMNLGLFAFGLDLMPDFGYPPVQFGGWGSARSRWSHMTASHNTVVVDGRNQANAAGTTTLWKDGQVLKAVRASCPAMISGKQYERTVATAEAWVIQGGYDSRTDLVMSPVMT